jgi:MscS family membrane protein
MDFLDQVFFNNTIRSYLIVAVAIFVVLMLKRYLSRYLISLSYKLITRKVSKESFVNLVIDPLKWFLVVLVSVFAIDKLNFPGILLYTIYGHSTADIIARIGAGAIIVSFIWLALRVVDFIAVVLEEKARLTADTKDNQLVVFFRDFLKAIITIIGPAHDHQSLF